MADIIFDPIDDVLRHLKAGGMVVLAGDSFRGGDVDFIIAAEFADEHAVNFMALYGRGLICLGMTQSHAKRLGLNLVNEGPDRQSGRPFAVSIEAREGVSTGISAADRAHTIATAIAEGASSAQIITPGHVFPLIARDGGVLVRQGAVEAALDLMRLAGLRTNAVLCSILRDDGTMARIEDMADWAREQGLKVAHISDLTSYRNAHDALWHIEISTVFTSRFGGDWHYQRLINATTGQKVDVISTPHKTSSARIHFHKINVLADLYGCPTTDSPTLQDLMLKGQHEGDTIIVSSQDPIEELAANALLRQLLGDI